MKWSKYIDIVTFNDSFETWNKYFKNDINPKITFYKFYQMSLMCEYLNLSVDEYIKMKPENSGLNRLRKKTVEEAYNDKPRGDDDIKSVYYHMLTKKCVSPIVLIKVKDKKNKTRLIKLDGVHRLVAAKFTNSQIRVLIINAIY